MDLLWFGVWSFALPSLMFLVPQIGFHWIAWNHPLGASVPLTDVFGGTMAMVIGSLLPAVLYLETRRASQRGDLSRKGLALFTLSGVLGASLLGFGLPLLYALYLHPNGYMTALPHMMVLGGFVVWMTMMFTRKLVVRKPAD